MPTDRHRQLDETLAWDAVVIGAGLGGLMTAALLAKGGKKVLVLDQHRVAGGNATEFRRKGYVFDVGVHYVGDCEADGKVPTLLREVGVDVKRLLHTFPGEEKGIRRYCRFLRGVWRPMQAGNRPLALLRAVPSSWFALTSLGLTLEQVLDKCSHHPRLRTVLCGPIGDHGIAPSRVSALLHAGLVMHYLHRGGFYPAGGGQVIADGLCNCIEAQIMCLTPSDRAAWGAEGPDPDYRRLPGYLAAKQSLRARMLDEAEALFPGLTAAIGYEEMATPLTHGRFTLATNGSAYGLAGTPAQFLGNRPAARTTLPGLYLAGASTRAGHGVCGALMSGEQAARSIAQLPAPRAVARRPTAVSAAPHLVSQR